MALDRAKKAAQKERKLGKHREQHQLMDQVAPQAAGLSLLALLVQKCKLGKHREQHQLMDQVVAQAAVLSLLALLVQKCKS